MHNNFTSETKKQMIASYVNGTLKAKDVPSVEEIVGSDKIYQYYYDRKVQERDFLLQMIPQEKLRKDEKTALNAEIRGINQDLLEIDQVDWKTQIREFLAKPVFTIKF
ncbi:MAG: hypothetical protein CME65_01765 [Halobacteriovoraceae bacterium]|nr:hypothetical protein [Halobacteriovoraceae bacterium]